MKRLQETVKSFAGRKILVVGDVMLDSYVSGEVSRISPEAPVPVVHLNKEVHVPGGAANAANNIRTLGGMPYLVGVVGNDPARLLLTEELEKRKIQSFLVVATDRPTTRKMRVVAGSQQMLRLDSEKTGGISPETENAVIRHVESLIHGSDAILVSDYGKGVITENIISRIRTAAGSRFVIADPRPRNAALYKGVYVITPNCSEAREITGFDCSTDELAEKACRELARALDTNILLKRGADGITLLEKGKPPLHIRARARELFDVSGAGDTTVAVMALAAASGADLRDAAEIANCAGGIKVGKRGTAPVHAGELIQELEKEYIESPKVWGKELWVVNNDRYCGKIMYLKEGFRCSLHSHTAKHETFYILSGAMFMETGGKKMILKPGDSVQIPPGTLHKFTGLEECKFIEFSTHHEESDSIRHTPSEKVPEDEFRQLKHACLGGSN